MTPQTGSLIALAFGLGFALGVFATARLDRRAAFRLPSTDEWSVTFDAPPAAEVDEHGWTTADHAGLEGDLRVRPRTWPPGRPQ